MRGRRKLGAAVFTDARGVQNLFRTEATFPQWRAFSRPMDERAARTSLIPSEQACMYPTAQGGGVNAKTQTEGQLVFRAFATPPQICAILNSRTPIDTTILDSCQVHAAGATTSCDWSCKSHGMQWRRRT
jgi:hypothetical protein